MLHRAHLLAPVLALAPLVGCGNQLIPNTDVPDSVENREAVARYLAHTGQAAVHPRAQGPPDVAA